MRWVGHLRDNGFEVEVIEVDDIAAHQESMGVPADMRGCHSAMAGEYHVEGHVPADLLAQFLEEGSGMAGISVPGMIVGPPGMEGDEPVPYDVMVFDHDGGSSVYASR